MEYNESVKLACLIILPCAIVSASSQILLSYLDSANHDKLISEIKLAIASGAKKENAETEPERDEKISRRIMIAVRAVLLVASVVFIIEGITNGGLSDVLIKAINICTECIGLG